MDVRSRALGLDNAAEENTVSYEVFPASADASPGELEALRAQLLDHLLPHLRGYIWQRDRFALQLSTAAQAPWQAARRPCRRGGDAPAAAGTPAAAAAPPHLWGSASFGDNIEDEWFVVWLLLEATRALPVTARVWDNDGEFLLIEAAYGLPRWLKPETAQNRVWLHGGGFHLVPLPRCAGDPLLSPTPSLAQALAAVRGSEVDTAAPGKMQAALLPRVSAFPGRASELMHVTHAVVPARVAHLLRAEPQLAAAAVEAFHYRTPDDVKAAARMAAFPPQDMVLVALTLSRCLYAQLALQEFAPPRGYPLSLPSDPQFKAAEVGLKLTAGFEMVCANRARYGQAGDAAAAAAAGGAAAGGAAEGEPGTAAAAGQQQQQQQGGAAAAAALAGDPGWAAYCARLEAAGYFRGALPGSAQHTQLLGAAAGSYASAAAYRAATAALAAPAARIDALLAGATVDPASFPPAEQLLPPGSEAWLQEGADPALDAELAARQAEVEAHQQRRAQRTQRAQRAADGPPAQEFREVGEDFDPGMLAGKLRAFVDAMAGLEGAELPEDVGAALGGGGAAAGGGGVALDEAKFAAELQRVLGLGGDLMSELGAAGINAGDSDGESSEEGSSFFSGSDDDEGDDSEEEEAVAPAAAAGGRRAGGAVAAAAAAQQAEEERWEAGTATDSDDDAQFMDAYGKALDAQLAATRMAESFERAPPGAGEQQQQQQQQQQVAGGDADTTTDAAAEAAAEAAALRPIDVDLNLVNSLLASYGEQQGLPGPAGSLAGLLGLRLPDGTAAQQQGKPPAAR